MWPVALDPVKRIIVPAECQELNLIDLDWAEILGRTEVFTRLADRFINGLRWREYEPVLDLGMLIECRVGFRVIGHVYRI